MRTADRIAAIPPYLFAEIDRKGAGQRYPERSTAVKGGLGSATR